MSANVAIKPICGRCIKAIQSSGESIMVGNKVDVEVTGVCYWCKEESEDTLVVNFGIKEEREE